MYFEAHLKLCLAAVSALRIFRDRYHGLVVQFLTVSGKLDRFFNSELKQVLYRYIFSQKIERYLEISETNNYVDYNDHTYILAFLKYEIHTVPIIFCP